MQMYTPDTDERLRKQRLDGYYKLVRLLILERQDVILERQDVILERQDGVTELLPVATTAMHADHNPAWMRDNVYSMLVVWGLAQAYRRYGDSRGRQQQLEQAAVQLMRGLLLTLMKQLSREVEGYHYLLSPPDALRARYKSHQTAAANSNEAWKQLQVDAIALFLLLLAQMTAAGRRIVLTLDEVDLVQNLVHCLGHSCRLPSAGCWESQPADSIVRLERSASVIGMIKAALEALRGFDLLGGGDPAAVIQVPADDIAQARAILESLLPRESVSRETDAALLSVIGFPAYAVEDPALVERTRAVILSRLQGPYGCRRFPGDAHLPQLKDHAYEPAAKPGESAVVEPEWPLFFAFLLVDGAMRGELEQARYYRQRLETLWVESHGQGLLPECYYLPAGRLPLEPAVAGKPRYLPAGNLPLLCGQSLYLLGILLQEGYISPADIDPLGRRRCADRHRPATVRLALLAEDSGVAARLATLGLPVQALQEIQPLQIRPAAQLEVCFRELGRNTLLGLPGRLLRPLGSLVTCQVFTLPTGETAVFLPAFLARRDFYLSLDNRLLTARLRAELSYIHRHWAESGPPVLIFLVSEAMLKSCGQQMLLALLQECQAGRCNEVPVKLGKLNDLLAGAARLSLPLAPPGEPLDARTDRHSPLCWRKMQTRPLASARAAILRQESDPGRLLEQLFNSRNLYEQIELLGLLWDKLGPDFKTAPGLTLRELTEVVYDEAGAACLWSVVRRAAGRLDLLDPGLEDAVAEILLHGHYVSVGRAYSNQAVITQPLGNQEIMDRLRAYGGDDSRCRALLQEIILFLGMLIKADSRPFSGITTLRPRHLLLLITGALAREWRITRGEACEVLLKLSPNAIFTRLRQVLTDQKALRCSLAPLESLHYQGKLASPVNLAVPANDDGISLVGDDIWSTWREISGVQPRLEDDFFQRVWTLLDHCRGVVIGDQLDPRNYLDHQPTPAESPAAEFAVQVEYLLNIIQGPAYRQLNIEALMVLADIFAANTELQVEDYLVLDVLIGTAVQLAWREANPGLTYSDYNERCSEAWSNFYASPPHRVAGAIAAALSFLLEGRGRQAA